MLSIVHRKQTVYQLRHISSPLSFLIRFLGWDCHSVVDCVPGPRFDPQHCKHAGCSMCEGSVPSSKKQVRSWYCRLGDNPSLCHVTNSKV